MLESVNEFVYPQSKMGPTFDLHFQRVIEKEFPRYVFYIQGRDVYLGDKKIVSIKSMMSINNVVAQIKKKLGVKESTNESTKLTDIIKEALTPKDKKVVQAFYNQKPLEGKLLYTDGKTLEKLGMGRQDIAKWDGSDIVITAVMDTRSTQSIVKYLKKYIPSGILKK